MREVLDPLCPCKVHLRRKLRFNVGYGFRVFQICNTLFDRFEPWPHVFGFVQVSLDLEDAVVDAQVDYARGLIFP